MIHIEVRSSFQEYWRYNVVVMLEGIAEGGESEFVVGSEDIIAEVGCALTSAPDDYPTPRITTLHAADSTTLRAVIYVVPHTMPTCDLIEDAPPFEIEVEIRRELQTIHKGVYPINRWSGTDVEIKL